MQLLLPAVITAKGILIGRLELQNEAKILKSGSQQLKYLYCEYWQSLWGHTELALNSFGSAETEFVDLADN